MMEQMKNKEQIDDDNEDEQATFRSDGSAGEPLRSVKRGI